jgi:single-stranded DNA-specific DHH superfamily exonuclease
LEFDQDKRLISVHSGIDGILFSTISDRFARPGRILAKIAGKKPLKEKGEDLLTS